MINFADQPQLTNGKGKATFKVIGWTKGYITLIDVTHAAYTWDGIGEGDIHSYP